MRPAHQTKWISITGRLEQPSREMRPKTRDAPERFRPGDIRFGNLRANAPMREHRQAKARFLNSIGLRMEHHLGVSHSKL